MNVLLTWIIVSSWKNVRHGHVCKSSTKTLSKPGKWTVAWIQRKEATRSILNSGEAFAGKAVMPIWIRLEVLGDSLGLLAFLKTESFFPAWKASFQGTRLVNSQVRNGAEKIEADSSRDVISRNENLIQFPAKLGPRPVSRIYPRFHSPRVSRDWNVFFTSEQNSFVSCIPNLRKSDNNLHSHSHVPKIVPAHNKAPYFPTRFMSRKLIFSAGIRALVFLRISRERMYTHIGIQIELCRAEAFGSISFSHWAPIPYYMLHCIGEADNFLQIAIIISKEQSFPLKKVSLSTTRHTGQIVHDC